MGDEQASAGGGLCGVCLKLWQASDRRAVMVVVGTSAEATKDHGLWEQQSQVLKRYTRTGDVAQVVECLRPLQAQSLTPTTEEAGCGSPTLSVGEVEAERTGHGHLTSIGI